MGKSALLGILVFATQASALDSTRDATLAVSPSAV